MRREIRFKLNGAAVSAQVAPHESLVEVLQEAFGLYGARESCGQGLCGCCTVLVNGTAVSGCLYLGTLAENAEIQTIEAGEQLDAVQEAFIESGAFQCGFCTSGQIMTTKVMLDRMPNPTEDQARLALAGNLCRCSAYKKILESVMAASRLMRA